eukprot:1194332-Prorocentrum_minimum.AAC.1
MFILLFTPGGRGAARRGCRACSRAADASAAARTWRSSPTRSFSTHSKGEFAGAGGEFAGAGGEFADAGGEFADAGGKFAGAGGEFAGAGGEFADVGGEFAGAGGELAGAGGEFADVGGEFAGVGGEFTLNPVASASSPPDPVSNRATSVREGS